MTIHVRPELEELVKQAVERGSYQSIDEYVERALQTLHAEEELLADEKDAVGEQITGREGIPGDVARARMQERKAAWHAEQQCG